MHRFRAIIERGSLAANSWSFVTVPDEIAAALTGSRRVKGTIASAAYDGSLQSRGGGVKTLLVKRELRDALGLTVGQEVDVTIEPDNSERPVDVPKELATALDAHPVIARAFAALAPSHRREYAAWIADAKKPETKMARISRALEMIEKKQHVK